MWDTTTIVAVTGALSAAAGGLIGVVSTKAVDGYLKIRKARAEERMEVKNHEAAQDRENYVQATAAYQLLIQQFEARVGVLEKSNLAVLEDLKQARKELDHCKEEHAKALVAQADLRGELKALQVHVERLWAHDKANKDHVAGLEAEAKKLAQVVESGALPVVKPEG